jgi:hypothetical protein
MSAGVASPTRAAERLPRWSSTGHARARPDRWSALLPALHSSQKDVVVSAPAKPVGASSRSNHSTAVPPRLNSTPIAAVKSP